MMTENTQKASLDLLERLHNLIAKDMLARLESGECEAKDWAVIVKFLKDNGIDMAFDQSQDATENLTRTMEEAERSLRSMLVN
ncbi:hypothetical protein [Bartonella sp. DGB2]|uniref:hypothetical protein n=1 Tax=Bartonella sp. DGB2 TaxID=3388426 RepID=UPI0039902981